MSGRPVAGLFTVLMLLVAAASPMHADDTGGFVPSAMDALIQDELSARDLPSISVTLMQSGEVIYDRAIGLADRDKAIPATTSTAYSLASVSKTFTTAALMALVEQGKIDLDRPVNDYLGKEKLRVHLGDPAEVTVRRVADHTAGLPIHYYFYYADQPERRPDMDTSIREYGHVVMPAGERFNYSNFGYGLLDYVIERSSGLSYGEFLAQTFFKPLGMSDSATTSTLARVSRVATGYGPDGKALPPYDFDHRGASAVFASTRDLALFGSWFLGQEVGSKPVALSMSSRDIMVAVEPKPEKDGDQTYGLGINVRRAMGQLIYSHSGNMPGVSATMTLLPELDLVIAIAINSSAAGSLDALSQIRDSAISAVAGVAPPEPKAGGQGGLPKPLSDIPEPLQASWAGAIETSNGSIELRLSISADGTMNAQAGDGPEVAMAYFGEEDGVYTLGIMQLQIDTQQAQRFPHGTMLRVARRGSHLSGAATAFGPMALSYWVDLTVQPMAEGSL